MYETSESTWSAFFPNLTGPTPFPKVAKISLIISLLWFIWLHGWTYYKQVLFFQYDYLINKSDTYSLDHLLTFVSSDNFVCKWQCLFFACLSTSLYQHIHSDIVDWTVVLYWCVVCSSFYVRQYLMMNAGLREYYSLLWPWSFQLLSVCSWFTNF